MRSPIVWFGGKGNMIKKLLEYIPEHKVYVEVFGGGASLLFAKEPSGVEIYNDLDDGLVNFFRMLRDPEKFTKFYHYACLTPYARQEFYDCRDTWEQEEDEILKVWKWFVIARMSFSGLFGMSWSSTTTSACNNMTKTCSSWLSILELLPKIAQRMMRVQIEKQDWETILDRYDTENTFFYLDPPYISATRKGGKYKHEFTDVHHQKLVGKGLNIKGKIMLSGYDDGKTYKELEKNGWEKITWQTVCSAGGRAKFSGKKRIENPCIGKGSGMERMSRTENIWINFKKNQGSLD